MSGIFLWFSFLFVCFSVLTCIWFLGHSKVTGGSLEFRGGFVNKPIGKKMLKRMSVLLTLATCL